MNLLEEVEKRKQKNPFIIGIEGLSGSGKTHTANLLQNHFDNSTVFSTDLFINIERKDWIERVEKNSIELKEIYDLEKIKRAILKLKQGEDVTLTNMYNLENGLLEKPIILKSSDNIIIEGLFSLSNELKEVMDMKIFLDVDLDTALKRTKERDEKDRNYDVRGRSARKKLVYDSYLKHIREHKNNADIIHKN